MNTLIFLPCFNDNHTVNDVLKDILSKNKADCLIIDDGSKIPIDIQDGDKNTILYRFERNQGIGVCSAVALSYAKKHNYENFIRIDSDGEHKVSDIKRLIKEAHTSNSNVVIGQRINDKKQGQSLDLLKNIGKVFINSSSRRLTNTDIYDWWSGFMYFDKKAIQILSSIRPGTYPEAEYYLNAIAKDLKISTVDIEQNIRDGDSTMSLKRGVIVFLRFCIVALSYLIKRRA